MLRVVFDHPDAILPAAATPGSAGYDVSSCEHIMVPPRERVMINTGIRVAFPEGHYLRVAPRSGIAYKNGIDVLAGVIDYDYRGVVKVILMNHSDTEFEVCVGDRIAQLILEKISLLPVVKVDSLEETDRGDGGFGSTGTGV